VLTLNIIYQLTLTDNHIKYGCEQRTIKEWKKFLDSDEIIETKRNTKKFSLIEVGLKTAINYHKLIK